jgi:DNA-directed RNA polymerase II subunit RPB2
MELPIRGDEARELAEGILKLYFRTQDYPYTRHHIESYDQFLSQDLPAMVQSKNPILILEEQLPSLGGYMYRAEIFVGGLTGNQIYIGTPTVSLKDSEEVRILYPNEARLRNLTYASMVEADIVIRVTFTNADQTTTVITLDPIADPTQYGYLARFPLCKIPILLHSRFCILHGKPQTFLQEVGECQYDNGGYFIVDGAEKVLVTRQEKAFNTLYITEQKNDKDISIFSSISCLNPKTRQLKRVAFTLQKKEETLQVILPFVRKPVPVFLLFRALGVQTDEDILRLILPDPDSAETTILEPLLHESILEAFPFLDTHSAIQYMKVFTKGFSEAHVLDIIYNQVFIHVENRPGARAAYLAECVRKILRVKAGIDRSTDRDDTRNQRCLTSGVLTRMLFDNSYKSWMSSLVLTIGKEYKYNKGIYQNTNFLTLFSQGTLNQYFKKGALSESILSGFKGKWSTGSGPDGDKGGVLQALSRLSYLDFMSHCRRVVLDFDTGMKLQSPRRLHTSQYGYFCTSETPGGASIGITKNMSILATISTATDPRPVIEWLLTRGSVLGCLELPVDRIRTAVPVYVNSGIVGYTMEPLQLRTVLKLLKWTGCLPASASVGFSIRERRVFIYLDEGRPLRPLIHLGARGAIPLTTLKSATSWRNLVLGHHARTSTRAVYQTGFLDPFEKGDAVSLDDYVKLLSGDIGAIEYVDPYEANEAYVANFPENIQPESSHLEIHPSTIVGLLTSIIPYANHNQSPRNQLSCSQSKQGVSVYATNYPNRFENQAHVLCYGQAPLVRTLYYDYLADGQMGYGHNLILAMGSFTGYNQDDGILMNGDSFARGMFRSMFMRSYEAFEEDDLKSNTKTRIGNPAKIPGWTSLRPGLDYSKLDERGIVREGEYVDENTVVIGMYLQSATGEMTDASVTAQVWTSGRVEATSTMLSALGLALVKVRVIQERVPELGDKFSNRHGQKGTIGMFLRGHDMPRTRDGIPVDMIMNPHAMPSRMTMAQLLESLLGKAAGALGAIGNATMFMNEGNPVDQIGRVLRDQLGMEPLGDDLLYDGMSGQMIPSTIFVGNVYTMRLKHMTEDKWNARGAGRREQKTHQPTGGRGNQGGLRIGEMERDAILGHGISGFMQESLMKRADGYETIVCNGCGTIPIYNEKKGLYTCPLCAGPVKYIGETASSLELIPSVKRDVTTFSKVEIPYAVKLLDQELSTYLNMGMRMLTGKDVTKMRAPPMKELTEEQKKSLLSAALPERVLAEIETPEMLPEPEEVEVRTEDLAAMGAGSASASTEEEEEAEVEANTAANTAANAATNAATNAQNNSMTINTPAGQMQLQLPNSSSGLQMQQGVEELDLDSFDFDDSQPPLLPQQQQNQQNQQIQVQTASQPVLVIPMNVAPPAPPAEYLPSAVPGGPGTFVVDTSPNAMKATGLPPLPPPSNTRNLRQQNNSMNKTRRPGNRFGSNSGSSMNSSNSANSVITVQKLGNAPSASPAASYSQQVNVTKTG